MNENLTRTCPKCNATIHYKCASSYYGARGRNSVCLECKAENFKGTGNPFYGKTHTKEEKSRMSVSAQRRTRTEAEIEQAKTQLAKVTNKKPIYDCWLEKHGKDIADHKLIEFKQLQSLNQSGSGNPMYGKPSPQGSGNGWSGWFEDHFFRSLRELSMILLLESDNTPWTTGESKEYKIQYLDPLGKARNYFPDFITDTHIIEVKPKRLWSTPLVLCKSKYAIQYAKSLGLSYELVDPEMIQYQKLSDLIDKGQVKLTKKYQEKFDNYLPTDKRL